MLFRSRIVHVGEGKAETAAKVWLVFYDSRHETPVNAGENSGRKLANYNVVRTLTPIGKWTGPAASFPVDLNAIDADCDGAAVIVQTEGTGPIIAAARIDRTKR